MSWRHAVVRFVQNSWIFEDAGSTNGTFLGGSRVDSLQINSDCVFRLAHPEDGPVVLCSVIRPEPVDMDVSAPRAAGLSVDRRTVTMHRSPVRGLRIGRAPDNDLVLADRAASRYHTELQNPGGGTYEITDLHSHNGTFVNGERISRATVTERDIIGIGRATFRISGGELREFVNGEHTSSPTVTERDIIGIGRATGNVSRGAGGKQDGGRVELQSWPELCHEDLDLDPSRRIRLDQIGDEARSGSSDRRRSDTPGVDVLVAGRRGQLPSGEKGVKGYRTQAKYVERRRLNNRLMTACGKVIVLIPVHNELESIGDTIEAVLGQTRKPDHVYVLTDNCIDDAIAERAAQYPVSITCTVGNAFKKAGNLNSALSLILPQLDDSDVIMGFDADSSPDSHFIENALHWIERGYGSVGATFHGRKGGGMLGLLQRSEFARFARHQHRKATADVLSGTGWAANAGVMRAIAAARTDGRVYDVTSMVEDFELTLALRCAGIAMVCPADCRVTTDVMTRLGDWVSQRLRWQHGTLDELRRYGWATETRGMIIRQFLIYASMFATPATIGYLTWSFLLFGWQGINPLNARLYAIGIGIVILEQAWQARKAGFMAVLATLAVIPDFIYSLSRQVVYVRAFFRLIRKKQTSWGAGTTQ